MGCDGGTIPRRDELVKTKQKAEQKDATSENAFKWRNCALSQERLEKPIVACDLGRLYNKDSIIRYLLSRSDAPLEIASHIRQLKDITELRLTDNPAFKDVETKGATYVDYAVSPYICPTSGVEMNGNYKFMFNKGCGCVFSERAMKNVRTDNVCLKCNQPTEPNNLITLNPSDEERDELEKRMEARKAAAKAAKKKVKREIKDEPTECALPVKKTKREKTEGAKTATKNEPSSSGRVTGATKLLIPDKSKGNYSIANDPKASEALKSLFTTHDTAKNKPTPHWITHNPLFY